MKVRLYILKLIVSIIAIEVFIIEGNAQASSMSLVGSELMAFGHVDFSEVVIGSADVSPRLALGEAAIFGVLRATDRLTVTSEVSFRPRRYREEAFKIERLLVKYDLDDRLTVSLGKMHTPINYWNDRYHHGRIFFPAIDRPLSFGNHIPIHETGIRLSRRPENVVGMSVDLVVGSGQAKEGELFSSGVRSVAGRIGMAFSSGLDLRVSYYENRDEVNPSVDSRTGSMNARGAYRLGGVSSVYEGERWTSLTEFVVAHSEIASEIQRSFYHNTSYSGAPGRRRYFFVDYIEGLPSDVDRGSELRVALGSAWAVTSWADFKLQLEWRDARQGEENLHGLVLRTQFAVGF